MHPSAFQVSYAIGDVHGRHDLLDLALGLIERHGRGLNTRIILLGDLVDRGPDSRKVVERAMELDREEAAVCLKGNHEAMMLDGLARWPGPEFINWQAQGGRQTLASYGAHDINANPRGHVPQRHRRWLAERPATVRDNYRIYVHAGMAPGVALADQRQKDCLWIRETFLRAPPESFEAHVVHGHTPLWEGKPDLGQAELLAHRTNLDTGAVATGILTIGVFDARTPGGPVEILEARGAPTGAFAGGASGAQGL